jgi:DNA-binding SARP family transcriptional activator
VSWEIAVKLLGPLEVEVSGAPVRFDGAKQRTLFVVLALHAPEPVSADALLEALWGGDQPSGAVQALQKHISRLRHRLGEGAPVHHRATGYALEIDPETIDSRRLEELLNTAAIKGSAHVARGQVLGLPHLSGRPVAIRLARHSGRRTSRKPRISLVPARQY